MSPLFSNLYLNEADHVLGMKYSYCRFADNINIYCEDKEETEQARKEVELYLREKLGLRLNRSKSGVYPALNRKYLGYEFYRSEKSDDILIRRAQRESRSSYNRWHRSAIERVDRNYHIISDGILTRKDYTVLFENKEQKMYLPVETCGMLNVYSNVFFSSAFFEFAAQKKLKVSIFNRCGEYVGNFVAVNHYLSTKTMLKQALIYGNDEKRLEFACKIEIASLHNQRENMRYFQKHRPNDRLQTAIEEMSDSIKKMNECKSIQDMLLIEARAKQRYLQAFDIMINNSDFLFEKRTRKPPRNAINALISFGNTFLYRRIATEIYKTSLDIRIGFAHASNNRSESLNLDIAEIFKPIIVDKVIFTVIHKKQILKDMHFETGDDGAVYLNQQGKRIFIHEMEDKIYQKIKIGNIPMTYDKIMRNEIQKLFRAVMYDEKYKAYKYT